MLITSYRWIQASQRKLQYTIKRLGNVPILTIGGVNALIFPIAIITSVITARVLPKAEYGQLVYFFSGVGLFRLLVNLGFGMVISRDVAASWFDRQKLNQVVYSATVVRMLSIIAIVPILVIIKLYFSMALLEYMTGGAICAALADFIFAIIAGSRLTWHISLMTAIQPVIYLLLGLGIIGLNQATSQTMMLAYILSFVAMMLVGLFLALGTKKFHWPTRNDVQITYIKGAIGMALPSYLASLSSQAWSTLVAGAFGSTGQFERSAEFGIAFSIVTLSIAISGPTIITSFFPQMSYLHSAGQQQQLLEHIRKTIALFLKSLAWVGVLLCIFANFLVAFFGAQYAPAASYVIYLTPITPIMGIMPIFTLSLFAINKPWRALIGLGLQLAILLTILLTGDVTINRLVFAVLTSTVIGAIAQIASLTHALKSNLFSRNILKSLFAGGALFIFLQIIAKQNVSFVWQASSALLCSIAYGIIAFTPTLGQDHNS